MNKAIYSFKMKNIVHITVVQEDKTISNVMCMGKYSILSYASGHNTPPSHSRITNTKTHGACHHGNHGAMSNLFLKDLMCLCLFHPIRSHTYLQTCNSVSSL